MEQAMAQMKDELVQMVKVLETRSETKWEIWDKKIVEIEEKFEKIIKGDKDAGASKSPFKHKDAKDVKPGMWDEKMLFADLNMGVRI